MDDAQLGLVAAQIARGERSVSEVVTGSLSRLDELEDLNAVAWRSDDAVMRVAAEADAVVSRGEPLGFLHGIPITVKDWIDVSGFPCAGEDLSSAGRRPDRDATVVKRLRDAGAIVIAKTNVNSLHGVARNPWDRSRTAGHSSSGEAIAVATGASIVGIGSDSGGSLRFPAHCVGIATIKPTLGRVPATGHYPHIDALTDGRTVIGPMGRSVADVRTILDVIAGPDGIDPDVHPIPWSLNKTRKELRVLVHQDADIEPSSEVANTLQRAADALADAGHSLERGDVLCPQRSLEITQRYWDRPLPAGRDHERLLEDWQTFRKDAFHQMVDRDVILSPAAPHPAPPVGAGSDTDWAYTLGPSLWGYPAVVFRFGTSREGLPLGLQVVAKAWDESLALSAAETLEDMATGSLSTVQYPSSSS
ncbi:MAG: amidase [Actinomycetota bacterium]